MHLLSESSRCRRLAAELRFDVEEHWLRLLPLVVIDTDHNVHSQSFKLDLRVSWHAAPLLPSPDRIIRSEDRMGLMDGDHELSLLALDAFEHLLADRSSEVVQARPLPSSLIDDRPSSLKQIGVRDRVLEIICSSGCVQVRRQRDVQFERLLADLIP